MIISLPASADEGLVNSYRMNRTSGQGDKSYHEGMYERARASYMRAKDLADEKSMESQRLHFNIGDTFYKEGKYDEAAKEYEQVVATSDVDLRARTYYNLGNVNFQKGLAGKDIKALEEAVGNYQKTLELDPDDQDAKFNIEVVRRLIKMQKQEQQQNPQCNNPQNKDGQNDQKKPGEDQKDQNQPGEDRPDQNKPDQDQQPTDNQKDAGKPETPEDQKPAEEKDQPSPADGDTGSKPDQPPPTEQPAGSAQPPDKISPEEAKRMLQAVREKEKDDLKQMLKATRAGGSGKDKDW